MKQLRCFLRSAACAISLGLAASAAEAFESFGFNTPGSPDELRTALRSVSLLLEARREEVSDPQEVLASARAEYSRLLGVLYSEGYYGGTISVQINGREAADFGPFEEPGEVRSVVIRVVAGPRYAFSRATVDPLARRTELPEDYRAGAPASTTVIRQAADAAIVGWRAVGNAKARISDQSITVQHDRRGVRSELFVDPGPKLRFGELEITGNEDVRTRRVRKIAGLPTGETFDPEEVRRAADRLRRTGTFRSVSLVEAESANPDGTLDFTLNVIEQRPRRYGFGVEYSTVEGLAVSAFWLHRNLLGGAERLRVEGEWSGIDGNTGGMDYRLGARFTRPATPNANTDFFVVGEFEQLNEPDFTSRSISGAFGVERTLNDIATVSAGLGFLVSEITDDTGTEQYRFIALPLGATLDNRDDALDATEGYFADLELMPFVGLSGSSSGARLEGDTRAYLAFGETDNIVLAGRVQFGSILGAPIDGVPNDMRFYSGGGGTVRGQDYQSLDVDLGGVSSGGRSLVVASAEARVDVTDNIGVVTFADWGFVGENSVPDDTGSSHAGAGIGLRYNTGIGPIRLDIATPVTGDDAGGKVFIYIGIGQAF